MSLNSEGCLATGTLPQRLPYIHKSRGMRSGLLGLVWLRSRRSLNPPILGDFAPQAPPKLDTNGEIHIP
jgi:hypothetical protein